MVVEHPNQTKHPKTMKCGPSRCDSAEEEQEGKKKGAHTQEVYWTPDQQQHPRTLHFCGVPVLT